MARIVAISSVLARGSGKERCFLRDQSTAVVLITFFQPHQRKTIYLRAEEHHSLARTLYKTSVVGVFTWSVTISYCRDLYDEAERN